MRRLLILLAFCAGLFALPPTLRAQDIATLIADRVEISGNSTLIADGGVEVLYQGRTLRASRIVYDQATDRLIIDGPIVLTDGTGNIVFASQAELSADLQDGVLASARLVLNQQLQIAAQQMFRVGGRYTQLSNSVASSCQVCQVDPVP
ncbi:MAG: LPS-assembly protein LptD, partial [Paracoccaceae bacterium]